MLGQLALIRATDHRGEEEYFRCSPGGFVSPVYHTASAGISRLSEPPKDDALVRPLNFSAAKRVRVERFSFWRNGPRVTPTHVVARARTPPLTAWCPCAVAARELDLRERTGGLSPPSLEPRGEPADTTTRTPYHQGLPLEGEKTTWSDGGKIAFNCVPRAKCERTAARCLRRSWTFQGGLSVRLREEEFEQGTPTVVIVTLPRGEQLMIESLVWHSRRLKPRRDEKAAWVVGLVVANPSEAYLRLVAERDRAQAGSPRPAVPAPSPAAASRAPAAAPKPMVGPVWRVQLQLSASPRSRTIYVETENAENAAARALEELGARWIVLEVTEA